MTVLCRIVIQIYIQLVSRDIVRIFTLKYGLYKRGSFLTDFIKKSKINQSYIEYSNGNPCLLKFLKYATNIKKMSKTIYQNFAPFDLIPSVPAT